MFGLVGKIVGAAALGALGYLGYKRFFGSTDAMACAAETPWYLPTPKYACGQSTENGAITGMQYQSGEWVYQFANGTLAKESALHAAGTALTGAAVQIL